MTTFDQSALRVFAHATRVAIRIASTPTTSRRKASQASTAVYANAVTLARAARDILGRAPRYRVEVHDGTEWVTAAREELLEVFDDDTRNLPLAHFDTRPQAEAFITTMCGLMHCGGDRDQFRIVDEGAGTPEPGRCCPDCERPNQFA